MLKKGSQAAKNYMAKLRAAKGKSKPKKMGALPVGFIGKFWGVSFKIQNQFDIYNNVEAIIEAKETGEIIATITGNEEKSKAFQLYNYIIHTTDIQTDNRDKAILKKDIDKFIKNLHLEVKKYNSGNKKIAPVKKITIPAPKKLAAPKVKKSSVIKITNKAPQKIVKSGNSIQYWEIEKQKIGSVKPNNMTTHKTKIYDINKQELYICKAFSPYKSKATLNGKVITIKQAYKLLDNDNKWVTISSWSSRVGISNTYIK